MANMKHVGKLSTGQKVVILFKTVPNETQNCLVTETQVLPSNYHDRLMELVESDEGQQSSELADLLSRRFFADGGNVLNTLHARGFIKKVNTKNVLLTPNNQTSVPLNEVNDILAAGNKKPVDVVSNSPVTSEAPISLPPVAGQLVVDNAAMAKSLLEQAAVHDAEAARLRKNAQELSPNVTNKKRGRPPKSTTAQTTSEVG